MARTKRPACEKMHKKMLKDRKARRAATTYKVTIKRGDTQFKVKANCDTDVHALARDACELGGWDLRRAVLVMPAREGQPARAGREMRAVLKVLSNDKNRPNHALVSASLAYSHPGRTPPAWEPLAGGSVVEVELADSDPPMTKETARRSAAGEGDDSGWESE